MPIDPDGLDLEWFAVDADGHLGFFTSAGSRIVPESILSDREILEQLGKRIASLPKVGRGIAGWAPAGELTDWFEMAERGLYAYDFHSFDTNAFMEGEYRLIASPSQPIKVDVFDGKGAEWIGRVTWTQLCFAEEKVMKRDIILGT